MSLSAALYIVATPIGNLEDMSARAIAVLNAVDLIAAEDTRHSRRLLQHFQITTPMQSYHQHNEAERTAELIQRLQHDQSIAVISDAGTPLISDPGQRLVAAAHAANITVVPIPGACAITTALCAAGFEGAPFVFLGFLPAKQSHRLAMLQQYQQHTETLVLYEAPHRIIVLIEDLLTTLGPDREVVIARELTKQYETIHRANVAATLDWLRADSNQQRGEFVVIIQGAPEQLTTTDDAELLRILNTTLSECPLKQAVKLASQITGEPKNKVYQLALTLKPD